MKIEVKNDVGFQPIELKLTIETEEELCDLWHRLNIGCTTVNSHSNPIIKHGSSDVNIELFREINSYVTKYNLKR